MTLTPADSSPERRRVMARSLDVYLNADLVGQLVQDDGGRMLFAYTEDWPNRPGTTPLSQSLPCENNVSRARNAAGFSPAFSKLR
jgi:HipA-like protein